MGTSDKNYRDEQASLANELAAEERASEGAKAEKEGLPGELKAEEDAAKATEANKPHFIDNGHGVSFGPNGENYITSNTDMGKVGAQRVMQGFRQGKYALKETPEDVERQKAAQADADKRYAHVGEITAALAARDAAVAKQRKEDATDDDIRSLEYKLNNTPGYAQGSQTNAMRNTLRGLYAMRSQQRQHTEGVEAQKEASERAERDRLRQEQVAAANRRIDLANQDRNFQATQAYRTGDLAIKAAKAEAQLSKPEHPPKVSKVVETANSYMQPGDVLLDNGTVRIDPAEFEKRLGEAAAGQVGKEGWTETHKTYEDKLQKAANALRPAFKNNFTIVGEGNMPKAEVADYQAFKAAAKVRYPDKSDDEIRQGYEQYRANVQAGVR